ncbi:MAG: hypothetical protein LH630_08935 [Actinomycetia bacterium]|nr:hypothetical protein [Actinomycetes bacterium]
MADKRAYFKLDVGYLTNPKVAQVMDESATAIVLHVGSIAYSAQHLTDGEVPVRLLLRLTGATKNDADLLLAHGLWIQGQQKGLAHVHDYLEHQRSATEVKGASEAGKLGAEARWHADRNADRMPDAMPIASETEMPAASESAMPREREERERKKKNVGDAADAPRLDVRRVCDHLADRIEGNGSKRPTIGKTWNDSARLMLDNDDRTEDDVHRAIDWCQANDFWRANVMSMSKMREKFDQMRLQAERDNANVHPMRRPGEGPDDWMRRTL